MNKKTLLRLILLLFVAGAAYAFYVWNKPQRDVTKEAGLKTSATAIYDSFSTNENSANARFLNKAIEVTGVVSDVKKNQAGNTVVYLQSNDPVFGINCTFKEDPGVIEKGSTITFKGICTGFLSDVIVNEGVLVK